MSPSSDLLSRRAIAGKLILAGLALLAFFAGGCRAHPVSLVMMIAGDAVNDADVKDRRGRLIGKAESEADIMFGSRLETLVDVERPGVGMIIYPVPGDLLKASRYIVEVQKGSIVALAKTKRNIDGIEDAIMLEDLKKKLIGKTSEQCRQNERLGVPLRTFRSRDSGQLLRIYDVRHWTDSMGARYCAQRFGRGGRCEDVRLVGVSAATRKDPARRGRARKPGP